MSGTGYETTDVDTYSQGLLRNEDHGSSLDTLQTRQENPVYQKIINIRGIEQYLIKLTTFL
jgi:hypothetical protein